MRVSLSWNRGKADPSATARRASDAALPPTFLLALAATAICYLLLAEGVKVLVLPSSSAA